MQMRNLLKKRTSSSTITHAPSEGYNNYKETMIDLLEWIPHSLNNDQKKIELNFQSDYSKQFEKQKKILMHYSELEMSLGFIWKQIMK